MLPLHQGTLLLKLVADHIVFQFCILVPATYDFACTCCVHTSPSPRNFQPSLLSMWLIGLLQPILHPHIYIGLEIRAGFDFPGSPAFSPTEDPRGAFDVSRSASNCRMAIHAVGYVAPWVRCSPSSAQHVLGTSPTTGLSVRLALMMFVISHNIGVKQHVGIRTTVSPLPGVFYPF